MEKEDEARDHILEVRKPFSFDGCKRDCGYAASFDWKFQRRRIDPKCEGGFMTKQECSDDLGDAGIGG